MSIIINKQPNIYSSAKNINVFEIQSDNVSFAYFKIDIYINNSPAPNSLIASTKFYPTPTTPNKVYIDVNTFVTNLLRNEFLPMGLSEGLRYTTKNVIPVYLDIKEYSIVSDVIVNTANQISNTKVFWNGFLNPFEFPNLNNYFTNSNNKGKILTKNKIRKINQHFESWVSFHVYDNVVINAATDQLYYSFFNQEPNLSFSNFLGDDINIVPFQPYKDYKFFNINVSYQYIKNNWGSGDLENYQLRLMRGNSTELDRITYVLDENDCRETVNVYFINSLGAWETLQIFNPVFDNEFNRTNIDINQTKVSTGGYNDFQILNNRTIYNNNSLVINTEKIIKMSGTTDDLRHDEMIWLNDIFDSEMIYIKYKDVYLPAKLETKKLQILSKKNNGTNFISLQFTIQNIF